MEVFIIIKIYTKHSKEIIKIEKDDVLIDYHDNNVLNGLIDEYAEVYDVNELLYNTEKPVKVEEGLVTRINWNLELTVELKKVDYYIKDGKKYKF